jgi:hypothetical protein
MKGLTSEGLMGAVAEGTLLGVLTGTEIDGTIGFRLIRDRRERGTLVGPIAEGLRLTVAAGAPIVGLASFNEDGDGRLLRDVGGGHGEKIQDGR